MYIYRNKKIYFLDLLALTILLAASSKSVADSINNPDLFNNSCPSLTLVPANRTTKGIPFFF